MKTNLENGKLLGMKRAFSQESVSTSSVDYTMKPCIKREREKAKFEAEHRKAQAITILRRYTTFC